MFLNRVLVALLTAYNTVILFHGAVGTGGFAAPLKVRRAAPSVLLPRELTLPNRAESLSSAELTESLSPRTVEKRAIVYTFAGRKYAVYEMLESVVDDHTTLYSFDWEDKQPAILKVVKGLEANDTSIGNECDYLTTVGLFIHCERDEDTGLIVQVDVRNHWPKVDDRIRTYTQWLADPNSDINDWDETFGRYKELVNNTIFGVSQMYQLYHYDLRIRNFLVDTNLTWCIPTNYAPPRFGADGVLSKGERKWISQLTTGKLLERLDANAIKERQKASLDDKGAYATKDRFEDGLADILALDNTTTTR